MELKIIFSVPEEVVVNSPCEFTIELDCSSILAPLEVISHGGFSNPDAVQFLELYDTATETWNTLIDGLNGLVNGVVTQDTKGTFRLRASFSENGNPEMSFSLVNAIVPTEIYAREVTYFKVEDNGTPYMDIYNLFLNSITDDRLALLTEEELEEELLPLLIKSIFYLCRLAKEAGFDLHDRDDEKFYFKQALTEHEQVVLGYAMVVCWTEQQLNSTRLITQTYYDAGIKTYSPNDTMRNLLTLYDTYNLRLKNKLTEYTYKTVDVSQFGGNE